MYAQGTSPPLPSDQAEAARIEHTRLRRRILYGTHEQDVVERLTKTIGNVRREAWGPPDMTSNPYLQVWTQLAALYRESPQASPPSGAEDAAAAIAEAGYWTLMQRVQRDTLGLREMLVRVDLDDEGQPVYRTVPPDMVRVEVNPFRPSEIVAVREWIPDPDNKGEWVVLVVDPRTATYRAENTEGTDVSERVLGGNFEGEAYPWRPEGKPVLPYVLYHAANTGYAFDPYTGREAVEGTLQLSVHYSLYGHILRNAAWAQKYIIGAEPAGLSLADGGQRAEVITDPATALILQPMEGMEGQSPQVGQWTSPVDPRAVIESIQTYERRIVGMALGAAEVTRAEADVRSGYSLAVSRESQREAQRGYEPLFRRSDLKMVRLTAGLMGLPTQGWDIKYHSIPRDPRELKAEMDHLAELITAGLMDKVTAYQQLHPGMAREEAEGAIKAIAETNRRFAV